MRRIWNSNLLSPSLIGFIFNIALWLVLVLIFTTMQLPQNTLFWKSLQNSGHSLGLCLATIITLCTISFRFNSRTSMYWFIAAIMIVLSILIELLQHLLGRGASFRDLVLDAAGVAAGILIVAGFKSKLTSKAKYFMIALGIMILAWSLKIPAKLYIVEQFSPPAPILFNFETVGTAEKIQTYKSEVVISEHAKIWPANNSNNLKVIFSPGRWPSVYFLEPFTDWSNYSLFAFFVFNIQNDSVKMRIKITDDSIGILNESFMTVTAIIPPGYSAVRIPFTDFIKHTYGSGQPTFTEISKITFFLPNPDEPKTLYFDDLRLE